MSFFGTVQFPTFSEKYEFGFPGIKGIKPVFIQFRQNEVEFKILFGFSSKKVITKPDDIVEVGLNQESYRSAGKAAAGAIVGGLLTGGIGLLAGAAMGGKRRKENQLILIVRYMGVDCDINISPSKDIPKVYSELKRLMSQQTKKIMEIESPNDNKSEITRPVDITEQLVKLHELLQKGILTQEEFDSQKRKILL